jgi:hypothetical protein
LKLEEASRLLEKAVRIYRNERRANSADYKPGKLVQALDHLAVVKAIQLGPGAGRPLFEEGLSIASSANLQGRERGVRASVKTNLGGTLIISGELSPAEILLREALAEF